MGKIIIICFLLGIVAAAACIGFWFGSWIFKLSAMKTAPYLLVCLVGVPLVAAAVAVQLLVVPIAMFLKGIIK